MVAKTKARVGKSISRVASSKNGHNRIADALPDDHEIEAAVEKVKGKKKVKEVVVPDIDLAYARLHLKGVTTLITNRMTQKVINAIRDKQQHTAQNMKGKRDPDQEARDSMYVLKGKPGAPGAVYGVPAAAIKKAMVMACRYARGLKMTGMKGAFYVQGETKYGPEHEDWVEIKYRKINYREDAVRLANGNMDLRYRAEFVDWEVCPVIEYNANAVSLDQLAHLARLAGFSIGICELRPERSGHTHGRWQLAELAEMPN